MHQAQQELLVLAAQNGNEQAYECLITIFHPQLVKFGYSLSGDHSLANDAVQDVWLSISKKLRHLKDPRAFKSWLFRAVRWRVLDLQKAKSYSHQNIDNVVLNVKSIELDESEIENRQLLKLIANLPIAERSVIYLFYLAELPIAEIAAVLEIPAGTVKSRLNRARTNLQQLITV